MLSFKPQEQTERENYKLLTGSIIPRPIAFVTSMARDGTINGAPFSYFNIVSSNPPLVSISVQRKDGMRKDTARNIAEKGEFVIHIVDEDNVQQINETAASLPADESEIIGAGLSLEASDLIEIPGVKEAKIRFECRIEQIIELKSEQKVGSDLIIGRIVTYHIADDVYENGRINQAKLAAVSRLAGSNYAKVGETFSIERPK